MAGSEKHSEPTFVKTNEHKIKGAFLTFQDGGRYHIETSPLICSANQWTGF